MDQFPGFSPEDFNIFTIPEFHERMTAIRTVIRPKLARLGDDLAPKLQSLLGHPMYPHTASHARRRVNPPDDTWVAFSRSERGYKRFAHFEVGIARDLVFVRFVIKPEGEADKAELLRYLKSRGPLAFSLSDPAPIYWYRDDHGKEGRLISHIDAAQWPAICQHVEVKSHGFTVGISLDPKDPVVLSAELVTRSYNAVAHLSPLYLETVARSAAYPVPD